MRIVSLTCHDNEEYTSLRYFGNVFEAGIDHPLLVFLRCSRIEANFFASLDLPSTPFFDLAAFHAVIDTWPRPKKFTGEEYQTHEA